MKIEKTICDFCGALKGDSNHWFWLYWDKEVETILVGQKYKTVSENVTILDLCGQNCLIGKISELLNPRSEPEPTELEPNIYRSIYIDNIKLEEEEEVPKLPPEYKVNKEENDWPF